MLSAPDGEGFVDVMGIGATPQALVFAYNEDTELGVIGTADEEGAYGMRLEAQAGHTVTVWQRAGMISSAISTGVVPPP